MRLNQFDYFRAIAIIFIVAGHTISGNTESASLLINVLERLVTGGSALFVFISGFFFHHIFYKNFNFKIFMIKKIQNVFVPYLILTIIIFILYLIIHVNGYSHFDNTNIVYRQMANLTSWFDTAKLFIWSILVGKISAPYWYVPFIIIMFLLSPLFVYYIKLSKSLRISIFIITLLIAAFVHRPFNNLNPLQAVIYYLPIYLLGILSSMHRIELTNALKSKKLLLFLLIILLSVIEIKLPIIKNSFNQINNKQYAMFEVLILQKVFLCFFILALLNYLEKVEIKTLKLISAASFAIFFLHYGVFKVLEKLGIFNIFNFLPNLMIWLLKIIIVMTATMMLAYLIKFIFKNKSKYLIGW